jgi:phenylacetic acid degradation operon negative regulatory protein
VSRLAADGWLERRRIGRQSQYRLAPQGLETFRTASRQIYAARPPAWTGRFDLAVGQPGTSADLPGFGSLAPLVWLRPSGRVPPPVGDDLLLLSAEADPATARRLAGRAWPLAQTDAAYRRFLESFDPLDRALAESGLDQAHAFVARILLIHDYRRIILRDPLLPPEILPPDWPGEAARALCAALYRRLLGSSERWLDAQKGPLPPPGPELAERFR